MSRDIIKLFLFLAKAIAIILLLDFALGKALYFVYGKMTVGERARAHFVINKSKADVFIFGSSRALYHYNPTILQDSLDLSVYNAGRSAQSILYDLPVFKMILRRHVPKMVILDLNESELVYAAQKYDMLSSLLPYYPNDEGVRQMIDLTKPALKFFSWSYILPYNSSGISILYRALTSRGEQKDVNGYIFMVGHKSLVAGIYDCEARNEFDPKIIETLREFVSLCRKNNIRLLAVMSPRFMTVDCPREDIQKLKQELGNLKVEYLDFSNNKKYTENLEYMYDEAHLNYDGSVEFTKEVANYIKNTTAR